MRTLRELCNLENRVRWLKFLPHPFEVISLLLWAPRIQISKQIKMRPTQVGNTYLRWFMKRFFFFLKSRVLHSPLPRKHVSREKKSYFSKIRSIINHLGVYNLVFMVGRWINMVILSRATLLPIFHPTRVGYSRSMNRISSPGWGGERLNFW